MSGIIVRGFCFGVRFNLKLSELSFGFDMCCNRVLESDQCAGSLWDETWWVRGIVGVLQIDGISILQKAPRATT
jgi:hypothetical protein